MDPVRVAVVGLGFGRSHVRTLGELAGRAELVAVVDPVDPRDNPTLAGAQEREAILAVPHHRDLGSLLARGAPDVVAIATPIHTHLALARQALEGGSHVLLEKPPTATLAEHAELVEISRRTGRVVQIGFQARGGGGVHAVREAVAAGELGAVTGIGVVGTWLRPRGYYERAAWAGRRTLDGVTVMDGVVTNPLAHAVDVALLLDGAVTAQDVPEVVIDPWHAHDIEADDTTAVVMTTARGTRIAAGLTLCAPREQHYPVVTVRGTRGQARLHYSQDRVDLLTGDGATTTHYGRTGMLANLVDHLREGTALIAPVASTGAFMRVLEAARTGSLPRPIAPEHVLWRGEGADAHPVVEDVEEWCERVAEQGRTFTELGAPWTRD